MKKQQPAFSLVELLVAMLVGGILVGTTVSFYGVFRKSLAADVAIAEASQNARVVLDRLSREIRQAPAVVTDLPADLDDNSVAQPSEIEFADGHANDLTYKRYYLASGTLQLQIKEYYFSYSPGNRVSYDAIGNGGVAPTAAVISTQDVADYVQEIMFYGGSAITIQLTTGQLPASYKLQTSVERRN